MLKHATISQTKKAQGSSPVTSGIWPLSPRATSSSVFNSPSTSKSSSPTATKCSPSSMIKVHAQTLGQGVEYLTLPVNAQTQSQHIIRAVLKKFRLNRDPNLFYLTLERWIRKDGLKHKTVMFLSDEACPLQLQQCCSNPPHNDIKFTLQMRNGAHGAPIDNPSSPRAGTMTIKSCHQRYMSAIVTSNNNSENKTRPPPEHLIWMPQVMPQVMPRRRNLTNASSTFGTHHVGMSMGIACNRRRYDPAQLAEDLNQLNLVSANLDQKRSESIVSDTSNPASDS